MITIVVKYNPFVIEFSLLVLGWLTKNCFFFLNNK